MAESAAACSPPRPAPGPRFRRPARLAAVALLHVLAVAAVPRSGPAAARPAVRRRSATGAVDADALAADLGPQGYAIVPLGAASGPHLEVVARINGVSGHFPRGHRGADHRRHTSTPRQVPPDGGQDRRARLRRGRRPGRDDPGRAGQPSANRSLRGQPVFARRQRPERAQPGPVPATRATRRSSTASSARTCSRRFPSSSTATACGSTPAGRPRTPGRHRRARQPGRVPARRAATGRFP